MGVVDRIVASATRIVTRPGSRGGVGNTPGQAEAWDMWQTVPEVGAYGDWISGAMSGATLFAGRRGPDGTVTPLPDTSRAAQLVSSIAGGPDGQSGMLGSFGTNLAIAGEAWLVVVPDAQADDYGSDRWHVLSTEEVKVQRGKFKVTIDNVELEIPEYVPGTTPDPDAPSIIRIWKSSPRRRWQATSPVIRSLVVLEELRLLNAAVAAIARSRITGRGVLLVPAGTRFPGPPGQDGADDSILDTFIEVSSTAIREPDSAAATVPIVLEVPGDLIAGVKWLQFGSEFDSLALKLRDEAVRRFATGADVPAEVLLGLGDASHWGAWAITAEALRMGAEPRLGLVCHSFTTEWLRPLLDAEDDPDADDALVWYDTSGLRSSSNKGASALKAYEDGLISGDAARRELGFTDADAPEVQATEAATVESAVDTATEGNDLPVNETEAPPAEVALAASAEIDVRGRELIAAVDGVAYSALVKAGERIMRTPLCPRPYRSAARELVAAVHTRHPVAPDDVAGYKLLIGAFDRVPELARRYSVDGEVLRASLHAYASALLVAGEPHTYDNVTRMLAQNGILPSTLIGMTREGAGTVTR